MVQSTQTLVRGHYYKLNKEYSKLRKYKYKAYQKHLMSLIQGLHDNNPKLYWEALRGQTKAPMLLHLHVHLILKVYINHMNHLKTDWQNWRKT